MKPTGLMLATGVLVVLGGTVWYFNKHPKVETPATPPSPKVLSVPEDQIEAIRLAKTGSDPIVLKKLADKWVIAEPKQMPADQDAVKSLTGSLSSLSSDRLIDDHPASLTDFGLSTPGEEVDITKKGGAVDKLLIGSDTPSGRSAGESRPSGSWPSTPSRRPLSRASTRPSTICAISA